MLKEIPVSSIISSNQKTEISSFWLVKIVICQESECKKDWQKKKKKNRAIFSHNPWKFFDNLYLRVLEKITYISTFFEYLGIVIRKIFKYNLNIWKRYLISILNYEIQRVAKFYFNLIKSQLHLNNKRSVQKYYWKQNNKKVKTIKCLYWRTSKVLKWIAKCI